MAKTTFLFGNDGGSGFTSDSLNLGTKVASGQLIVFFETIGAPGADVQLTLQQGPTPSTAISPTPSGGGITLPQGTPSGLIIVPYTRSAQWINLAGVDPDGLLNWVSAAIVEPPPPLTRT